MVRIGILGALQIERDGAPVELSGGRLRALVARLALAGGKPVTVGALVDAVWDDELPSDQQHALQSLISRARRALGDAEAIAPAPGGYRLTADGVDAHRFEELAATGAGALRNGDPEHAAATLREALGLWRGPALADLTSQPLLAAAAQLEDQRLAALVNRAEAELALGHGASVVGELEAALAEHPLHEKLAARHIAALYAAGRQADALAAYEKVRTRLADELGAAPSPDLQAAHLAVLKGDTPAKPKGRRSNLRAQVTSFVGRDEEVEHIGRLLTQSRLVTLVGPGGAGKTRLASEALMPWVDRVHDGVWMVELAPVTAEVEIVPATLAALGLREAAVLERRDMPARDGLERLLDTLESRQTILFLDNCEHLIGGAAELADRLLADCPELRIVATSREPLAIAGENLIPIPPLGDDAIRLFKDRAQAASPGTELDEELVAEICRRLDGLPLAIELAAARLRTMPIEQLAARLDDRFRLLTGGSRAGLPRHRTLRAVVDWSWGLLEEHERALARKLAVFNAGATEESAAAVTDDPDVLDGLLSLVDKSLLQVVGDRYRMLETIREYGIEKLEEAGEVAETRTRHARYFAQVAIGAEPTLRTREQYDAFQQLKIEHDDLIAALRWLGDSGDRRRALQLVVAMLWFWMLTGAQDEAQTWVRFAVDIPGDADAVDLLIGEGILMMIAAATGGKDDAEQLQALAERVEREGDGRPLLALARVILALFSGADDIAETRLAETLEHPDPWTRAAGMLVRAHVAENGGDQEHMRADLEQAMAQFRDIGDNWALGMTLSSLSSCLMLADDLDGAETVLDEATELLDTLASQDTASLLWLRLAEINIRRGNLDAAREHV
ncbi:MAG TPA: BTAD domain-containing putative transcriptional regulator, partial [Solirubrobacter sp.]